MLKNAEKVKRAPTDRPTNQQTDKAGCRVAKGDKKKQKKNKKKTKNIAALKKKV